MAIIAPPPPEASNVLLYIKAFNGNSFFLSKDNVNFVAYPKIYELAFVNNQVRCSHIFNGKLLFHKLKVENIDVDGIVHETFENLSAILTPLLFINLSCNSNGGIFDETFDETFE